jgi:Ca2+-binding RTX toxin-like protein
MDPSLGWVIDTGSLPVYDHLGQSPDGVPGAPYMFGTWGSDAINGGDVDGWINGLYGDDVIYGTAKSEQLVNGYGNALFVAGGGNDIIWAGTDNDILDGGTRNDTLYAETGNDTYIFRRGSGQYTIIDVDTTPGNVDSIWLGSNLTPNDVSLKRIGNNLVLKIVDTTDTLTVKDFFRNDAMMNRVEQIQLMDGTVWTGSEIISRAYAATEGDDIVYGGPEADTLSGLGRNDVLNGMAGDDTLHGDAGDDRIYGTWFNMY